MAAPKFKQYYQLMKDNNRELIENFTEIHAGFNQNPDKWSTQFHEVGRDVLDAIRDWERRLCYGTEKGGYAKYSANLSEKYWEEVRSEFPLIDQVGVVVKTT